MMDAIDGLNQLEREVLDKLLFGDHPVLATLRAQASVARLAKREFSGVGFFCMMALPPHAPTVEDPRSFHLGDVNAEIQGLQHGAGFVLFVRDGRLEMLEGYTYGEPWPEHSEKFSLSYQDWPRRLPFPDGA